MASGHTVKVFDEDLTELRGLVSEMGGLAERAIEDALAALVHGDLDMAARIIDGDRRIDVMEAEVELQVVRLIALRTPVADDLRDALAALKIAGAIERMGDYAKNIARRVAVVSESRAVAPLSILPAMGRLTLGLVHDALDAFAARDVEAALAVCRRDQAVDDFYNSLFRTLLTHMMEDPANISPSTHLLFVAKNLERIGDHATNIGEMIYFTVTGRQLGERPRGEDVFGDGGAGVL